jgi:hypothetical protein
MPVDSPRFALLGTLMTRGKGVLEAIDKLDSLRVRSGLAIWMRDNHDAFADRLSRKLPDWVVLAKLFGEAGLTDRYGNPPKAETARKIWQRVRNEVKSARGGGPDQGAFPSVSKPGPNQRRSHTVTEPSDPPVEPTDEEPVDDVPPRFTFHPSKPR